MVGRFNKRVPWYTGFSCVLSMPIEWEGEAVSDGGRHEDFIHLIKIIIESPLLQIDHPLFKDHLCSASSLEIYQKVMTTKRPSSAKTPLSRAVVSYGWTNVHVNVQVYINTHIIL